MVRGAIGMLVPAFILSGTGCIVGQPPGKGQCMYLHEASTGAPYWLYLPVGYDDPAPPGQEQARHPLVMTFHGAKPFDNDNRQIREWQQEADRYGFVVCAPELLVADVLGPIPLSRADHPSLKRDERAIIAIMDELYHTVDIDANKVLATSWSYGGYVAHYMANRYPERFSCLAVRQSNFNADILDPGNVPRYRDHKVGVFYTQNDFALCKRESHEAAEWYARHGFDLTFAVFEKKGHERTPGVAAGFFARTIGLEPKTPPLELASMQVLATPATAPRETMPPLVPKSLPRNEKRVGGPVEVARAGSGFGRAGSSGDLPPITTWPPRTSATRPGGAPDVQLLHPLPVRDLHSVDRRQQPGPGGLTCRSPNSTGVSAPGTWPSPGCSRRWSRCSSPSPWSSWAGRRSRWQGWLRASRRRWPRWR